LDHSADGACIIVQVSPVVTGRTPEIVEMPTNSIGESWE
jgi:hypothetical protein